MADSMSSLPRKMPVWLVAVIIVLVILVLFFLTPLSTPIKRPLLKMADQLWSQRYSLDSKNPQHRAKAIRLMKYNQVLDDAMMLKLATMATSDSNATVRNLALNRLSNEARRQTLPDAVIEKLKTGIRNASSTDLPQLIRGIALIAGKHNKLGHVLIMDISRIAEDRPRDYTGNSAVDALGIIGSKQALPDASLQALTRILQLERRTGNVTYALNRISQQRPLPEDTIKVLTAISRDHKKSHMRSRALETLEAHCKKHACSPGWFQHALEDSDKRVRHIAARVQMQMLIKEKGKKQALAEILRDKSQPKTIRWQAITMLTSYRMKQDEDIKKLMLSLAEDSDADIRAYAVRHYGSGNHGDQSDPVWLSRIRTALSDDAKQVRIAAINTMLYMRIAEKDKITLLVLAMQDKDAQVRSRAISAITSQHYKYPAIRAALDRASKDPVKNVQLQANSRIRYMERKTASGSEKFLLTFKSKKQVAVLVFWILVFLSAVVAIGFLVYYVVRFIIFLAQRSWKAMLTLGVIVGWFLVSGAMAYGLIAAAFGLGGRGGVFTLLLVLLLGVVVYAAIGWGLRYPIRR